MESLPCITDCYKHYLLLLFIKCNGVKLVYSTIGNMAKGTVISSHNSANVSSVHVIVCLACKHDVVG